MARHLDGYECDGRWIPNRIPEIRELKFENGAIGAATIAFADLFDKLDLPVVDVDFEGGGHFEYEFSSAQLALIDGFFPLVGIETPDSIIIGREECQEAFFGDFDDGRFWSSNNFGDTIMDMQLVVGDFVTNYTLKIFTDNGPTYGWVNLQKDFIERLPDDASMLNSMANKLLGMLADPLVEETGAKEISPDEYTSFIALLGKLGTIAW